MTTQPGTRRELMRAAAAGGLALAGGGLAAQVTQGSPRAEGPGGFVVALNTSTISGSKPTIVEAMGIAAKAGYDGIEPWIRELDAYTQAGGTLGDLRKRAIDANLKVVDAIGFCEWAVDDDARRAKGLEEARRTMAMVAAIGGTCLAAPPRRPDRRGRPAARTGPPRRAVPGAARPRPGLRGDAAR